MQKLPTHSILILLFLFSTLTNSQICNPSQYFNGQRCAPCTQNCFCQADNTCDSCMVGFTFDTLFQNCLQCPTAVDSINVGCLNCCSQISGASFICSQCPSGSNVYLIGGQCLNFQGCLTVNQNGVCTACSSNFYSYQGQCMPCDASCSSCYDNTLCLTCNTGYYNSTNINFALCTACTVGCSSCSSAAICSSCSSGYRLTGSTCTACSSYCNICTATSCSTCNSMSALVGTVCYLCTDSSKQGSTGCTSCTGGSTRTYCSACSAGFYLNPTTQQCLSCVSKFPFSSLCSNTSIIQCLNDYSSTLSLRYHLVNNQCVSNSKLCKLMADSSGNCASCYFETGKYYSLQSSTCILCSVSGCNTYSTTCQCLSCQNGYQFINNQCIPCQNLHCSSCQSSIQSCDLCAPSYGRYSSACIICTPTNCNNCDGDYTNCSVCNVGYYLNSGSCYQCQSHCISCTSSQVCISCDSTTYLQSNGRCKTLPSNCLVIDSRYLGQNVGVCKKCVYGYRILSGNCYPCSSALFNVYIIY